MACIVFTVLIYVSSVLCCVFSVNLGISSFISLCSQRGMENAQQMRTVLLLVPFASNQTASSFCHAHYAWDECKPTRLLSGAVVRPPDRKGDEIESEAGLCKNGGWWERVEVLSSAPKTTLLSLAFVLWVTFVTLLHDFFFQKKLLENKCLLSFVSRKQSCEQSL